MDAQFWHQRWDNNQIGFHQSAVNALLINQIQHLSLTTNSRIFVPLCGKTRDIGWLLSQGYRVVGVELSRLAIEQLFTDLGVDPDIRVKGDLLHFAGHNIDIFVGDLFDASADVIGAVDAIYDRAALVALPEDIRLKYAQHIAEISDLAPQLVLCFEYDQSTMQGPPFSINQQELGRVYGAVYEISGLATKDVEGGLKGKYPASETAWLLRAR